ncbi:MAG: TetR/AcrR family transcriptional regulator [Chloroflexota bacterium]
MKEKTTHPENYHHGSLRQELIEAGLAILEEENTRALTLRSVAKRAQVSHAAPYRHFADKTALLSAIAEQGFQELGNDMQAAFTAYPDDPRQCLIEIGKQYVAFGVNHPAQLSLMFSDLLTQGKDEALGKAASYTFELLTDAVRQAQQANVIKSGDTQPIATSIWAMVHGLAMLIKEGFLVHDDLSQSLDVVTDSLEQLIMGVGKPSINHESD